MYPFLFYPRDRRSKDILLLVRLSVRPSVGPSVYMSVCLFVCIQLFTLAISFELYKIEALYLLILFIRKFKITFIGQNYFRRTIFWQLQLFVLSFVNKYATCIRYVFRVFLNIILTLCRSMRYFFSNLMYPMFFSVMYLYPKIDTFTQSSIKFK